MHLIKLEVCIQIMKTVAQRGPQTLKTLQAIVGENPVAVQRCLDFLLQQGIMKEVAANRMTYANTKRAQRVLEYFHVARPRATGNAAFNVKNQN